MGAPGCGDDHGWSCSRCRFWMPEDDREKGACHRNAPSPLYPTPEPLTFERGLTGVNYSVWPLTWCEDWCGEFVAGRAVGLGPVAMRAPAG